LVEREERPGVAPDTPLEVDANGSAVVSFVVEAVSWAGVDVDETNRSALNV
jgi:hypothetical protein